MYMHAFKHVTHVCKFKLHTVCSLCCPKAGYCRILQDIAGYCMQDTCVVLMRLVLISFSWEYYVRCMYMTCSIVEIIRVLKHSEYALDCIPDPSESRWELRWTTQNSKGIKVQPPMLPPPIVFVSPARYPSTCPMSNIRRC